MDPAWDCSRCRKISLVFFNGNCVEMGLSAAEVGVRDSKDYLC
jgi:hypothetical protein